MKNEEYAFTVLDENGKEVECEVIVTFESDETGKNYIVYTDNTLDENGCTKVFASIFEPNSDDMVLHPIETEKEWAIVELILEELQSEYNDGEDD